MIYVDFFSTAVYEEKYQNNVQVFLMFDNQNSWILLKASLSKIAQSQTFKLDDLHKTVVGYVNTCRQRSRKIYVKDDSVAALSSWQACKQHKNSSVNIRTDKYYATETPSVLTNEGKLIGIRL